MKKLLNMLWYGPLNLLFVSSRIDSTYLPYWTLLRKDT